MPVNGLRLAYELRGMPCRMLTVEAPAQKTIWSAPSFGVTITATDAGGLSVRTSFVFTINAAGTPPPASGPFSATVLSYNCTTGALLVGRVGAPGNGLVEYAIPGLTNYTTDANFMLNIGQLRDASTITMNVRQWQAVVQLPPLVQGTPFVFNFRQFCQSQASGRVSLGLDTDSGLRITVLGNPSADAATVDISGAADQSLVLRLMDVSGRLIERWSVAVAEVVERQTFDLRGQASAVLLLEVAGTSERKTVRLLRQ